MTMPQGRIATFYSYKGGVGRSFLLSNSAVLLAQWGYRVLCVDWDLEAPGLHYYFRPFMSVPQSGLTDMVLRVREGERVGALDDVTQVTLPGGATLDLIPAGGVGDDYVAKVQSIDWDALYRERDFGNVLEEWRERWIDSYDVVFVDSRTGISDSGGICTSQLPHILAFAFTANQQNVDGVLDVVRRAAVARNGLPYDRSRLLTLPLLCRFDMSEEYERAAEWRDRLRGDLKSSYDAWVPDGSPVERVLDNCTVPYSAYWSFGEDLPVITEDFRNPQLISHSIASIAALIARNLEDARLFTESRDAYVDAAVRTGRRGGHYQFDLFISGTSKTEDATRHLAQLLAAESLSVFSSIGESPERHRPIIDTCRHLVLMARDSVDPWHRDELNYFLRQTLDEQSDRTVFPVVGSSRVRRELPSLVQSLPSYDLAEDGLAEVAGAIAARVRSDVVDVSSGASSQSERGRAFILHAREDQAWAEWVAWNLREAGYEIDQDWPGRTGESLVATLMALPDQYRVVSLYGASAYVADDLAGLLQVPEKFVPMRIAETEMPPALQRHGFTDLFGVDEQGARDALLRAVANPGAAPLTPPAFPAAGRAETRAPEDGPSVWNVPTRHADFVGRGELMLEIRNRLVDGPAAAPLVLTGPCGVGKTRLAIEYAHWFRGKYDLVWYLPGVGRSFLAELAVAIGCAQPDSPPGDAVQALHQELRSRSRWLLIFDSVENPAELIDLLPSGNGHVLITSRNPHWRQTATTVDVDVLSRPDAVALLTSRSRDLTEADAARLADALDDLPLALVQAADALYVFPPDQYLQLLQERAADALHDDGPPDYPGSLTSQLTKSMGRLAEESSEAAHLLQACVLLAPAPLPLSPAALGISPHAFRQLLMLMERVGLARVSGGSIHMPRLTQAVLRDQLTPEQHSRAAATASNLLTAPTDELRRAELLPHLLVIAPRDLTTDDARYAALKACRVLVDQEHFGQAGRRLYHLYMAWQQELGEDSVVTLAAAACLAYAVAGTGNHEEARRLDAEAHDLLRRKVGDDHPDTLHTANNLAIDLADLGRTDEAVALGEDTLARRRRTLGDDHTDTLRTAGNLAIDLADLGRTEDADALLADTLHRQHRLLGEDHPDTQRTVERRKWRSFPRRLES
ncbi:FxSxx-COOH system tetratricopeptide repeat protein [Streptomyces sp. NBC_00028]|uniref:FxSxx-COOH system tetratricopeptide repeat protein n=1 Tax=Streptomyces sp. NBC_00028 TaxID=2975624 RepID=UPI00324ADC0B